MGVKEYKVLQIAQQASRALDEIAKLTNLLREIGLGVDAMKSVKAYNEIGIIEDNARDYYGKNRNTC